MIVINIADDKGAWRDAIDLLAVHISKADGFFRGERLSLSIGKRAVTAEDLQAIHDVLEEKNIALWALHTRNRESFQLARQLGLEAVWEADTGSLPVSSPPLAKDQWEVRLGPAYLAVPRREITDFQPPTGNHTDIPTDTQAAPEAEVPFLQGQETESLALPGEIITSPYIYRGTLRSGQFFRHAGTIVVLGDINPGAQVISGGDVFVWGRLRGVVHAGAMGDERAIVAALDFEPLQLRIAGYIAMSPKGTSGSPGHWLWKRESSGKPEVARIIKKRIVVDPWDAC